MRKKMLTLAAAFAAVAAAAGEAPRAQGALLDNPIVFVTQVPIPPEEDDQAKVGSVSANHMGDARHTGRGGDLWLREANGGLKNLTEAAGYGNDIAVRDPTVHWNGDRVIFSMVVGSNVSKWQLYEITACTTRHRS